MSWFEETDKGVLLKIRVIPRAKKTAVQGLHGEQLKIRLNAPPVDGKANKELIAFLSRETGVPRSGIELIGGETSRDKQIRLHAPTAKINKLLP